MKVILDSVDDVVPQHGVAWVFTFSGKTLLDVKLFCLHAHDFFVVFANETWDLTSCKHGVDGLEETLIFDLGICHQEGDGTTFRACFTIELPDVIKQVCKREVLGDGHLENLLL